MKRPIQLTLAALAVIAAPMAHAWSYKDGDVLLIFRASGFNDVEFNLGDVGQFLNHSNGYTATVEGWDLSLVTNTFGADLSGVSVVLAATTSWTNSGRIAWLSSVRPNTTAYNVTPSSWQSSLWSTINSLGTRPLTYLVPAAGPAAYSIDPNGSFRLAAYDQIVSANGVNLAALPQFGGNAPFVVEQVIPGTFELWGIQPSTSLPKPPDTLVGTFSITAAGVLTFVAGPPASTIEAYSRTSGVTGVTFSTEVGGNYWLAYSNQIPTAATWPLVAGPVVGTGNSQNLSHTNADGSGFYRVVRAP
jgi:hypothetical protein